MIGKPLAADDDMVDGIRYARTLPSKLPQTQEERLLAEVERALELVEEFRPHVIHATTNYYNAIVAQAVAAGDRPALDSRGPRTDGEDLGRVPTHRGSEARRSLLRESPDWWPRAKPNSPPRQTPW